MKKIDMKKYALLNKIVIATLLLFFVFSNNNYAHATNNNKTKTTDSTNINKIDSIQKEIISDYKEIDNIQTDSIQNIIDSIQKEIISNYQVIDSIQNIINNNNQKNSNTLTKHDFLKYVTFALALIFIILIVYPILNNRKSKKHARHQETLNFLNKTAFPHYDTAINDIKSKINAVSNELDALKRKLNLYDNKIESIQQNIENTTDEQNIVEKQQEEIYAPPPVERYYLPFPDKQGFFWDDKKTDAPASNSLFIIEIEPHNQNRGNFTLYLQNEKNIRSALTNASTFLKPVCEAVDNNFSGSQIEMIGKGILQLQNGKWNVMGGKKLKIKIS